MTKEQQIEIEARLELSKGTGIDSVMVCGFYRHDVETLLQALAEATRENDRLRGSVLKAWCHIDQDICIRWGSFQDYSLTEFRHGIRVEFNDILGIDEELESAFQHGEEAHSSIIVYDTTTGNEKS